MRFLLALMAVFFVGALLVKLVQSVVAGVVYLVSRVPALLETIAIPLAAVVIFVFGVWILVVIAKRRAARPSGRSARRVRMSPSPAKPMRAANEINWTGANVRATAHLDNLRPGTAQRDPDRADGQSWSTDRLPLPRPHLQAEARAAGGRTTPPPVASHGAGPFVASAVPKRKQAAQVENPPIGEIGDPKSSRRAGVTITIIVNGPGRLTGSTDVPIRLIHSDSVDVVAIGDHTKVGCETTYVVKRMHVDIKEFWRDLTQAARDAFLDVVMKPRDGAAIHRFQRLLDAAPEGNFRTAAELPAAEDVELNLGDCEMVVYGDHNHVSANSRVVIARATVPLDHLLKTSDLLVRRFAEAVTDPSAISAFSRALHRFENQQPSESFLEFQLSHDSNAIISDGRVDADDILALPIGRSTKYTQNFEHEVRRMEKLPCCELHRIRMESVATEEVRAPGFGLF
ncbi:hypothetical protein DMA12_18285 [Amycolatopsis balhimycina DSM 5908]|uniref:Uncharacterized protein n=1 Tax=Amycolatopsis balhimycina DSM 5908 TaxID=1081091 RepID=A0A428WL53_AMYBA|nr:hypothetical protein [Amycolatopsis balhimycina]RSM43819.1 hypothetical protein DMA12_18285 [Amycolatopsis balhimycina DSM 5908]